MLDTPINEWNRLAPPTERKRTTMEDRLQLIEDKTRLEEMINEYGLACDYKMWNVLQRIYHEDVEREIGGTLAETVKGRDALIHLHDKPTVKRAAGVTTKKRDLDTLEDRTIRHLISTKVVRVADDNRRAWALCQYQMAVAGKENGKWLHGLHEGTYLFSFEKTGDEWQFTQHLIWSNHAVNPVFAVEGEAH